MAMLVNDQRIEALSNPPSDVEQYINYLRSKEIAGLEPTGDEYYAETISKFLASGDLSKLSNNKAFQKWLSNGKPPYYVLPKSPGSTLIIDSKGNVVTPPIPAPPTPEPKPEPKPEVVEPSTGLEGLGEYATRAQWLAAGGKPKLINGYWVMPEYGSNGEFLYWDVANGLRDTTTTSTTTAPIIQEGTDGRRYISYDGGKTWNDYQTSQTETISPDTQATLDLERERLEFLKQQEAAEAERLRQQALLQQQQLEYQKQKDAEAAALAREQWLSSLAASPSNWIQYWGATHGGAPPPAPEWLSSYLGKDANWGKVVETSYVPEMSRNLAEPKPEDYSNEADYQKAHTEWWQATKPIKGWSGGITAENVPTPSGQWLNRNSPSVQQGMSGYANWSAGQNKSMTWDDLLNNAQQMLPTNQAYTKNSWIPRKQKGW